MINLLSLYLKGFFILKKDLADRFLSGWLDIEHQLDRRVCCIEEAGSSEDSLICFIFY